MNRFNDTHPQKATDHTVLMVYNTSIDTKIFTFQLPGWCARLPHPLYPYPINLMNVDLGVQCLQRICNISLYLLSIISRHPDFITF